MIVSESSEFLQITEDSEGSVGEESDECDSERLAEIEGLERAVHQIEGANSSNSPILQRSCARSSELRSLFEPGGLTAFSLDNLSKLRGSVYLHRPRMPIASAIVSRLTHAKVFILVHGVITEQLCEFGYQNYNGKVTIPKSHLEPLQDPPSKPWLMHCSELATNLQLLSERDRAWVQIQPNAAVQ